MPRFFFHLSTRIIDQTGLDLSNLDAARREARETARELARNANRKGSRSIIVTDKHGTTVHEEPIPDEPCLESQTKNES